MIKIEKYNYNTYLNICLQDIDPHPLHGDTT